MVVDFKTATPEKLQRRLQNRRLGLLADALVCCPHNVGPTVEHVQTLIQSQLQVKQKVNVFNEYLCYL